MNQVDFDLHINLLETGHLRRMQEIESLWITGRKGKIKLQNA